MVSTLLQGLAPILVTLVTSGLMYLANSVAGLVRHFSNPAKYVVLSVLGVVVSAGAQAVLGVSVLADPSQWTQVTAEGVASAAVAAVIFKFGQRK